MESDDRKTRIHGGVLRMTGEESRDVEGLAGRMEGREDGWSFCM